MHGDARQQAIRVQRYNQPELIAQARRKPKGGFRSRAQPPFFGPQAVAGAHGSFHIGEDCFLIKAVLGHSWTIGRAKFVGRQYVAGSQAEAGRYVQVQPQPPQLLGPQLGAALAAFYFRIQRPAPPQRQVGAELQPAHGCSATLR